MTPPTQPGKTLTAMPLDLVFFVMILSLVGAAAGVIAGLFGIGGGVIIVPALYYVFGALGADDAVRMHAAVATSLATIVVTSLRSVSAHAKRGAVDGDILRAWTPWIVLGAIAGAATARFVPGEGLTGLFGVFGLAIAVRMGLGRDVTPIADRPPEGALRAGMGSGLGFTSSWLGIGGGVFGVLMLTLSGRPIHKAVGTAAGFGLAIGAPAAVTAILAGWGLEGRPPFSLGYVNVPGFALIAALTTLTAPLGARLAHGLSQSALRRVFAIALGVIALNMLVETGLRMLG